MPNAPSAEAEILACCVHISSLAALAGLSRPVVGRIGHRLSYRCAARATRSVGWFAGQA
jgi:hypothetical protein